jgi:hypothetical protein
VSNGGVEYTRDKWDTENPGYRLDPFEAEHGDGRDRETGPQRRGKRY